MAEILILGSTGGREHALAEALSANHQNRVQLSHGNPGTTEYGLNHGITGDSEQQERLMTSLAYETRADLDLVVIGPEAPLVHGIADRLRGYGLKNVFGPGADGARLEGSKAFAAEFMHDAGIATPDTIVARSMSEALQYADDHDPGTYVIKADGLHGGKGVVLPENDSEAEETICEMMKGKKFGEAGRTIVFQERLYGPEFSAYLVTDGVSFHLLPLAQDHKRLGEGDTGPNTGGMGAYTPVPFRTPELVEDINDIGERTMQCLAKRGIDYRGVIFLGGIIDSRTNRASILEYNVRFGDPETQTLMAVLPEVGIDTYDLLSSAAQGNLEAGIPDLNRNLGLAAISICLAAEGYPDQPQKGDVIYHLDRYSEGVTLHHGGTKEDDGQIVTDGGRVLYLTAVGEDVTEAAERAYRAIDTEYDGNGVYFRGMQFRTDIGHQARQSS